MKSSNKPALKVLETKASSKFVPPKQDPKTSEQGPIGDYYSKILHDLGEDPSREGLLRTPYRAEKAIKFLTCGYTQSIDEIVNEALFSAENDDMVVVKDIEYYSLCEHHILPFFGRVHVGYLPNKKIIGLSKIPRIVDVFARRLQVQERITQQIADTLMEVLEPRGVAVVSEAQHFCMMMRGVEKQCSSTVTSAMLGEFRSNKATKD
ncbi:MAG: GTP cyclohydrolase I FolE, partial [Planctomycetes bacterium]|nr:GTP cyclohydrolase I FolE [Planctomycetota bacterium]